MEQNVPKQMEPTITVVNTDEGPVWQVEGLGMATRHSQLWQAVVLYECLCVAKGIEPIDWRY